MEIDRARRTNQKKTEWGGADKFDRKKKRDIKVRRSESNDDAEDYRQDARDSLDLS